MQAKREAKKRRKQLRQELKEKAAVREEGSWEFRQVREKRPFCVKTSFLRENVLFA
eukprot:COSAG06_NODE_4846_length_3911_cov_2.296957_5_plen_56_part_00